MNKKFVYQVGNNKKILESPVFWSGRQDTYTRPHLTEVEVWKLAQC